ncbi:MAG: aldehyde dehydrogenase family protein [Spirochaetales bacterium]|nr:aldehyde dehydrogenase family protein [Spirochaetales bacterium]
METTKCLNVFNNEVLDEYRVDSIEDLKNMIDKSRKAQLVWRSYSLSKRVKILSNLINLLTDSADEIALAISKDNGKMQIEALAAEVLPAVLSTRYYLKNAKKILKRENLKTSSIVFFTKKSFIEYQPLGVVGIISPWNYPFSIAYSEVLSALIAGNGVILKTATETLYTGLWLKKLFESCGLPDGLFSFLNMAGRVAGDALLDCGVNKLFFTGSVPVGKYLMEKASKSLTPVSLELGGNDAMLVLDDADLERASSGAVWAGLQNAGQSCGGVERIYVHENVYDEFMAKLKSKVEALRPGDFKSHDGDIGLMTTTKQKALVDSHIADALAKGAKIFAQGAEKSHPNYSKPVVLADVTHDMLVMRDETFGPVLGVMKFKTIDEAIRLANDSDLGLTGSVWTRNLRRGVEIARQIEAGAVTLNDHLMSHGMAETSWGGVKNSGIGRTHGKLGMHEMVNPKFIVTDRFGIFRKQIWWQPYNQKKYNTVLSATKFSSNRHFCSNKLAVWKIWRNK